MKRKGGGRKGREPSTSPGVSENCTCWEFRLEPGEAGGEEDGQEKWAGVTPEDLGARILSIRGREAPDCEPGDRTVPHPSPT